MNTWLQGIGVIVAAIVAFVGLIVSLSNRKRETAALNAKTGLDEAQQASIIKQLADSTEEMYIKRLAGFKDDIKLMRQELDAERKDSQELKDELRKARKKLSVFEEFFFTHHDKWDKVLLRMARENGWEIPEPPSYKEFLRSKGMCKSD